MLHPKFSEILDGKQEWKEIANQRESALIAVLGSSKESKDLHSFMN